MDDNLISKYKEVISSINQDNNGDCIYLWELKEDRIWFLNHDSDYDYIDKKCYSLEEWLKLVDKRDYLKVKNKLERIACSKESFKDFEYRMVNKSGKSEWISSLGKLVNEEEGLYTGRISINDLRYKIDDLTMLFNAIKFKEDMCKHHSCIGRGYFLLIGVDDLKHINIRHGRHAGDNVLMFVASVLEKIIPDRRVYRMDKDCFGVYLHGYSEDMARKLFEKIQESTNVGFTISAGACTSNINECDNLYQYAEYALDKAKEEGKNRIAFFDQQEYLNKTRYIELYNELNNSVKSDFEGFSLVYQPLISTEEYKIIGAEALLRYTSKNLGKFTPNEFIPILEETSLIEEVGLWTLKEALTTCKEFREYQKDFKVSVNISYVQLKNKKIYDNFIKILDEVGVSGDALTLEITESLQLSQFDYYNEIFNNWRKKGITISIDDFGTGYSSYAYLKKLEIDEIKIDRCFVSGINKNSYHYRLIFNVTELAREANIKTVCEGVEEYREIEVLEDLKPNVLQGHYFSCAISKDEIINNYFDKNSLKYKENLRIRRKLVNNKVSKLLDGKHGAILASIGLGLWIIKIDKERQNYEMYADETMLRLMGVNKNLTPKDCYKYWFSRVKPEFVELIQKAASDVIHNKHSSQIRYHWVHPDLDEIEIASGCVRVQDEKGMVCLQGYIFLIDGEEVKKEETSSLSIYERYFENMNEYACITNLRDNSIVYLNKKLRNKFNINKDECRKYKCYELLHNCNSICSMCNNKKLQENEFNEWEYYNPTLDEKLLIKDTLIKENGNKYRIELAINAEKFKDSTNSDDKERTVYKIANEGFKLAMNSKTPDESISIILEYLGISLNGEHTYIFESQEDGCYIKTHSWYATDAHENMFNFNILESEICEKLKEAFKVNKTLVIRSPDEIKKINPLMYKAMIEKEVNSLVIVSLTSNDEIIGFCGIDNPELDNLKYASLALETQSYFLTAEINRRDLIHSLHVKSCLDQLTQIGNRYALQEYVENVSNNSSIGVVYLDLTGLKRVNDTLGHEAGDELIIRLSRCLSRTFDGQGVFRIGGDEFVVVCINYDENKFDKTIEALKQNVLKDQIDVSIGSVWQDNFVKHDILLIMNEAEEYMYEEKARFYKKYGRR